MMFSLSQKIKKKLRALVNNVKPTLWEVFGVERFLRLLKTRLLAVSSGSKFDQCIEMLTCTQSSASVDVDHDMEQENEH